MRRGLAIILSALFVVSLVFAAGSSTKEAEPVETTEETSDVIDTVQLPQGCDAQTDLEAKIKCRLEEGTIEEGPDEACKGIKDPAGCEDLYDRAYDCYDMRTGKDQCLRREAGVTTQVRVMADYDPKPVRLYLVLLLYELQERIEHMYEDENITSENAAKIIASIVVAKKSILNDEPIDVVKQKVEDMKTTYISLR